MLGIIIVQVSSATATFAMTFSASMSVVEYYLLKRFPVPYGNRSFRFVLSFTQNLSKGTYPVPSLTLLNWFLYALKSIPFSLSDSREHYLAFWVAALFFVAVATVAAFIGQHAVRKLINILGRASLIIFILSFTIFVSAISLGKNIPSLQSKISARAPHMFS